MSEAGAQIAKRFPHIKWTGGSSIHRSLYYRHDFTDWPSHQQDILPYMVANEFGPDIFNHYKTMFTGDVDWLVSTDEFSILLYAELHSYITTGGPFKSSAMIKNPATGNRFHRIAFTDPNLVGGIRFWLDNNGFGYRFRWASMEDIPETEASIRKTLQEVLVEQALILQDVVEVGAQEGVIDIATIKESLVEDSVYEDLIILDPES